MNLNPRNAAIAGIEEITTRHILVPDNNHFSTLYALGMDPTDAVFSLQRRPDNLSNIVQLK